ncbi:MAG: hypothetical protein QOD86_2414 [Miltoncostaeaceae bacterium]|nr:hypothetical protein [Miltoncostaeaceae bacterium]
MADLPPGRALDAGCGHGAEAIWLAARRWKVTAVDFAAPALAYGRSMAASLGVEVDWIEADLGAWTPEPEAYDLVSCLYVHVAGPVEQMVERMAAAVAPGGTLLLAGATAAAGQTQVSLEAAHAALDPARWELLVAEHRPRPKAGAGEDAVIRARRVAEHVESRA